MASTYSALKIELMGTGDQSGTWGTTTNTNLGTAIEEAITGSADVTFASADVTLTLTNTNGAQVARNLRLNLIGTVGAAQSLIVPAIEKQYIVNNTLGYDITVKNATGTGATVPAGKSTIVFNTGANVVEVITALPTGTVIPVANGGTGRATNVAYSVVCGGTTTGGAEQSVASVGTSGQILTSNGAGALPSFQTLSIPVAFPAGTRMSFQQTAAPTGWTKDTTAALDNTAMRIVTGSVVNGGTVDFTTAFTSQTPTGSVSITSVTGTAGATTLTTPQIPSHTHSVIATGPVGGTPGQSWNVFVGSQANGGTFSVNAEGGNGSHDHPFSFSSGSGSFTGNAINLAVKYYDFIIASKD
jgi:hypothetical protein